MKNFLAVLLTILSLTFIVSLIILIIKIFIKKSIKKVRIVTISSLILFIICFFSFGAYIEKHPNESTSNQITASSNKSKDTLNEKEKALLKKSYKDFDVDDKTAFAEIEETKANKLTSSEQNDYGRLEKEKEQVVAQWKKEDEEKKQKQWNDFVSKNTKDFGAGEYTIGTHLDDGAYDITFNGSGNFTVYDSKENLLANEIGGDSGISKYRAIFTNGSKFKAAGMSIHTIPVQRTLRSYSNFSIYAGYWVVGQDITKGRYKASVSNGSGNFVIYGSNSSVKTNEILGNNGVKDVTIDLNDNDIIDISALNQVDFTPAN